jgi:hypothetical protein
MEVFKRIQEISPQKSLPISGITLSQFFGIELDDFAHEIAILSLWLAEHQMNVAFKRTFGVTRPSLPLKEGGKIVAGNAIDVDWAAVCPISDTFETYLLGNPPYLGGKLQDESQKSDLARVVAQIAPEMFDKFRNLDYIACWFLKGCHYVRAANAALAFVTTNSVCQGEQVELLWPPLLRMGAEIQFAHLPFKWENRAKNNAGVICIILGLSKKSSKPKYLFDDGVKKLARSINPYLVDGKTLIIGRRNTPIAKLPKMYLNMLARLYHEQGRYAEAEPLFRRSTASGNRKKSMNQGVRTSREIASIARSALHAGAFD